MIIQKNLLPIKLSNSIKNFYKNLVSVPKYLSFLLFLFLQGCWISDYDLIKLKNSDDPFNGAKNILFNNTNDDSLLLLMRDKNKNQFVIYSSVKDDKTLEVYKFHDITPTFGSFGKKIYIMQSFDLKKYSYLYVVIEKNKFVILSPKNFKEPKKFSTLNELKDTINEDVKNNNFKEVLTYLFEKSSVTQTKMAKKLIKLEQEEFIRKKEIKRKNDAEVSRRKSAKGLEICNNSDENAFVAFATSDSESYTTRGWYKISSKKCSTLAKEIGGKTYYYFAQGDKGGKWNGKYNLCFKPNDAFEIKGFNDCEDRGYKIGKFKKLEIANNVWEFKEKLTSKISTVKRKTIVNNNRTKSLDLDIGEGVYVEGVFSDELVYIMRIDHQSQRVKVQSTDDGTAKWVSIDKIISKEDSTINDVGRTAVTIGVIYCLFNPEECKK